MAHAGHLALLLVAAVEPKLLRASDAVTVLTHAFLLAAAVLRAGVVQPESVVGPPFSENSEHLHALLAEERGEGGRRVDESRRDV